MAGRQSVRAQTRLTPYGSAIDCPHACIASCHTDGDAGGNGGAELGTTYHYDRADKHDRAHDDGTTDNHDRAHDDLALHYHDRTDYDSAIYHYDYNHTRDDKLVEFLPLVGVAAPGPSTRWCGDHHHRGCRQPTES